MDDKLNIGSGLNPIPGFINLDISKNSHNPTIIGNSNQLPFKNNTFQEIHSYFCFLLYTNNKSEKEIIRILKNKGTIIIWIKQESLTRVHNFIKQYNLKIIKQTTTGNLPTEYIFHLQKP